VRSDLGRLPDAIRQEEHLCERDGAEKVVGHRVHLAAWSATVRSKGECLLAPIRQRVRRSERRSDAVERECGEPEGMAHLQTLLERRHSGGRIALPEVDHSRAHVRKDQAYSVLLSPREAE
jgi:hypothetical protein